MYFLDFPSKALECKKSINKNVENNDEVIVEINDMHDLQKLLSPIKEPLSRCGNYLEPVLNKESHINDHKSVIQGIRLNSLIYFSISFI